MHQATPLHISAVILRELPIAALATVEAPGVRAANISVLSISWIPQCLRRWPEIGVLVSSPPVLATGDRCQVFNPVRLVRLKQRGTPARRARHRQNEHDVVRKARADPAEHLVMVSHLTSRAWQDVCRILRGRQVHDAAQLLGGHQGQQ